MWIRRVVFNPAAGEVQKSYPLALALSRKMGEREQRLLFLGDADCLSDGELTRGQKSFVGSQLCNYSR